MTNKRRPRGTLKLVQPIVEAAPKPTKKVTQAAVKSSSKGPQSLSLAWDENEGMGQARDQRPLSEYERKDTLYRVYEGNTWVSACVDVISKRFTSGGWHLEEVEHGKGQQDTHDRLKEFCLAVKLLRFLRATSDDLEIYGESYAEIVPGGLFPQLHSLDCPTITYQLDEHGNILGYTQMLTQSNKKVQFKPEQIIRWWLPSKRAKMISFSPIEKLVNPTYADKSMVDWSQMFFRKGTRPSAWIQLGPESDVDDARTFVKFYKENYTGEQNAHVPPVMWGGAQLHEYGKGPIDIDFHGGRMFSREEILAGYGVPPAAIGIIESGNIGGGSGEDQDKSLRLNTVDPIKQLILEEFNQRIVVGVLGITDWIVNTKYADYRSDTQIVEVQQKRIFSGLSTPDEERQDSGKTPYPKEIGSTPIIVSGREVIPLERMGELADEQRQTATVTLQQQKAQTDLAQTKAEQAKEPPVPDPLQAPGHPVVQQQPPQQKAPPVAPQQKPAQERLQIVEQHTGMMIAFMLDPDTASHLALPDREPPQDMHVTLAFLGDKNDVTLNIDQLKQELASFAAKAMPLEGTTGGLGRFTPSDSSDNLSPVIALVNVPGLVAWRAALVQRLSDTGVNVANDFDFTPHITLAYIDADAPLPVESVPNVPLVFDQLCLAIGDDRTYFKIGTSQARESDTFDTSAQQVDWSPDNLDKRLQEYRDQGVEYLKWLCQSNACDLCFANDGQVRKVGEAFPNGAILPQCHDHCECDTQPTEKPKED